MHALDPEQLPFLVHRQEPARASNPDVAGRVDVVVDGDAVDDSIVAADHTDLRHRIGSETLETDESLLGISAPELVVGEVENGQRPRRKRTARKTAHRADARAKRGLRRSQSVSRVASRVTDPAVRSRQD